MKSKYHVKIEFIKDCEEGQRTVDEILKNPEGEEKEKIVVYFNEDEDNWIVCENINHLPAVIRYVSYDEVSAFLYDFV